MNGTNFFPKHLEREIPYAEVILAEGIYILEQNKGRLNRLDTDKQAVVIEI